MGADLILSVRFRAHIEGGQSFSFELDDWEGDELALNRLTRAFEFLEGGMGRHSVVFDVDNSAWLLGDVRIQAIHELGVKREHMMTNSVYGS